MWYSGFDPRPRLPYTADGTLPPEGSYLSISEQGVLCSAIKECEEDESEILRLYELDGKTHSLRFDYFGQGLAVTVKPYEIKTLKIEGGSAREVLLTEDE